VPITIEALSGQHERTNFSCGESELDDYFRRRAGQDDRRNIARVFVATDPELGVVGFYTLSTCAIHPGEVPTEVARKLPRYESIPAALIGRLARDLRARGRGIGELLLADAINRDLAADRSMAVWAILVDAKNQAASEFYQSFGFIPFPSRSSRLFLPTASARKAAPSR
jgi:GNAT superfamily N-acetyltransferase